MTKSLTYVEIDVLVCSLTYGTSPCMASIPETGAIKCFNARKTCQDIANIDEQVVTLRYAVDTGYLPRDIDAIPSIMGFEISPATISLGVNLGQRASVTVRFKDHPHADTLPGDDKYFAERSYDPFKQGTYWSKFRARQPFLRGRAFRLITGKLGQTLAEMETRHYIIDSFDGPTNGTFSIVAKDILKLADDDRSQAPHPSSGFLSANITAGSGTATLQPAGVGDEDYPAAGLAVIGGNEIVSFTRAGDALTLTGRGLKGTAAGSHNAQDRVQLVLSYNAEDAADILYDLAVNYARIPAEYIDLADWQNETATYLNRVYTTDICEPTGVKTLMSELIEQAALSVWWDEINRKVRLKVLRGILTDVARFTPENVLEGTSSIKEQPDKRLSRVQTYFGRVNPTKPLTDTENYRSFSLVIDDAAEADYGSPVLKTIFSRWIPPLGRNIADRVGQIQLGRFRDPPRRVTFDLMRYANTDPVLGSGYRFEAQSVQDATGAQSDIAIQLTRLGPPADRFKLEAEEVLFNVPPEDLDDRYLIVDANINNVNMKAAHDALYPEAGAGISVTCTINAGVVVGSIVNTLPAFDVGDWPDGVTLKLVVAGHIRGAGGRGGIPSHGNGLPGGTALYARKAITVEFAGASTIWGGGGGGSANGAVGESPAFPGAGGGGAGVVPGAGGSGTYPGAPGTETAGGAPGLGGISGGAERGGYGGGPGQAGETFGSIGGAGGAAGRAIDGLSFVTKTGTGGDIRGPQVN